MTAGLLAVLLALPAFADPPVLVTDQQLADLDRTVAASRRLADVRAREKRWSLRLPTLEIAAVRSADFLAGPLAPLTTSEIASARVIFADSVDYAAVRIAYPSWPRTGDAMTLGDVIRLPAKGKYSRALLIHELAHVWQYQTRGTGYISDSALHQLGSVLETGKNNAAYRYKIVEGRSIYSYTAEQQAEIAEDFYSTTTLRTDAGYLVLIAEIQASRPVKDHKTVFEEAAAGLPPRAWSLPGPVWGREPFAEGGSIPQIEIRFPGL